MNQFLTGLFGLKNKHAIVTGGASGIGFAIVQALANVGASVHIWDKDERADPELLTSLPQDGQEHRLVHIDVSDQNALRKHWADNAAPVDILINNAAIAPEVDEDGVLTMPNSRLRSIMDTNFWGYLYCARTVRQDMSSGGRIINISSVQGQASHAPWSTYQTSKAAVDGLTRTLACELGRSGINVIGVAPGAIATPGLGEHDEETINAYRKMVPLRRRGHPDEIAYLVVALCGVAGNYITGTTITADGGYLANITPINLVEDMPPAADDPDVAE